LPIASDPKLEAKIRNSERKIKRKGGPVRAIPLAEKLQKRTPAITIARTAKGLSAADITADKSSGFMVDRSHVQRTTGQSPLPEQDPDLNFC